MHSFGSFKKLGVDQNFYPLRTPSRRWTSSNTLSLERFTARHLTPDDRWQWDHTFNGEHFQAKGRARSFPKETFPIFLIPGAVVTPNTTPDSSPF